VTFSTHLTWGAGISPIHRIGGFISCDMTIKVRAPKGWFGPIGDLEGGDLACKPRYVGRVCYYYFCRGLR